MNTSLCTFSIILGLVLLCVFPVQGAYSGYGSELKSKYQKQLKPKTIESKLGQLVILKLPERRKGTLYLTKPNGDVVPLSGDKSKQQTERHKNSTGKYRNIFKENPGIFRFIGKRHIVLGPMTENHEGNWVISDLFDNNNGDTVEKYQFIAIQIVEHVPPETTSELLSPGDTFKLSFSNAPAHLETCELIPPPTAKDRYYERDPDKPNTCGYKVPNVTTQDAGLWTLIAVGKIAFTAEVELKVLDKSL